MEHKKVAAGLFNVSVDSEHPRLLLPPHHHTAMASRLYSRRALSVAAASSAAAVGAFTFAHASAPVAADVPPFTAAGNRYTQATYAGRLRTILTLIDPRTLAISDAELERCQALLRDFETGGIEACPANTQDEDLWSAKATVAAIVHPVTQEKMLIFGRMSAFVPMNVPTAVGMLSATTPMGNIFWQWFNQSYNVLNNYTCRAGATVEWAPLLQSYGLAVGVSCGLAVAGGQLMATVPAAAALGPFIPYLAVIAAGSCNVAFTRMDEIRNGVHVFDADGNDLGVSVKAGQQAVLKTVTTRSMFLPIFPLLIPPTVMKALRASRVVGKGGPAAMAAEVAIITLCMAIGLPCALAILPQRMVLPVESLEAEFTGRVLESTGKPVTEVYANKGL